ncbi:MAG: histidinol-phosphate transaminase [Victivallaceae bacterium]
MNKKNKYISYFRPTIDAMDGYTPGEQPKILNIIKLNTNENPYPPSPKVKQLFGNIDYSRLRLYCEPQADGLRDVIAGLHGVKRENVIAGNGSDDILTIAFRAFTDSTRPVACLNPTYSLYPVLAQLQGAECMHLTLNNDFSLPDNLLEQAKKANMLIITRPNAPTGNSFPMAKMVEICENFNGIVLIDEAYADFADDNCIELAKRYNNVIVSRTLSKSYSMAGLRLGYAIAAEPVITGMMKVKDSYNVDMLTQLLGAEALSDQEYLRKTVLTIRQSRKRLIDGLQRLGFYIVPSAANFIFAAPPDKNGERLFKLLRDHAIIVRYFPGEFTGSYIRITIGTDEQVDKLLKIAGDIFPAV